MKRAIWRSDGSWYNWPVVAMGERRSMEVSTIISGVRLVATAIVAVFCAACSTIQSITPSPSALTNLVSFNSTSQTDNQNPGSPNGASAEKAYAAVEAQELDCPQVEVQDGTAAMRVGGEDNQSVRYQFDITQTARECKVEGSQFAIKVGVAGRLLIGPAGAAGTYSSSVRIVVRNDATSKPVVSKLYKVEATADAAGGMQSAFQVVSEPLMLPYEHKWADQDYTVLVGFDTGKPGAEDKHARKKHAN
jgi:hypothetical protein